MNIGLDLDNTIVCYDRLFYDVASEREWIPPQTPAHKTAIRDYLRGNGREDDWTRLQGVVYGAEMFRAAAFDGFVDFVNQARGEGHRVHVVSHRTKTPYLGAEFDLHQSAADWLANCGASIDQHDIYFETTREAKIRRVAILRCDIFVDDLPELLTDQAFPPGPRAIWFNPARQPTGHALESVASWAELSQLLGFPEAT